MHIVEYKSTQTVLTILWTNMDDYMAHGLIKRGCIWICKVFYGYQPSLIYENLSKELGIKWEEMRKGIAVLL